MDRVIRLQERLLDIAARVERLDLGPYEGGEDARVLEEVANEVVDVATAARTTFDEILDLHGEGFDAETSAEMIKPMGPDFETRLDRLAETEDLPDLCFLATMEMRQRLVQIQRLGLEPGDSVSLLSSCSSLLRKTLRAATAIENALSHGSGIPSRLSNGSLTRESLEVRRAYAKLRRSIEPWRELGEGDPRRRLATVATAISELRGREIYFSLRLGDRLALRSLQDRIVAQLEEPGAEPAISRLWQDVITSLELLRMVSRRSELREHDRRTIRELLELFADTGGRATLPAEAGGPLESLLGLDDALDEFLFDAERLGLDGLRSLLSRVFREHFGGGHGELLQTSADVPVRS